MEENIKIQTGLRIGFYDLCRTVDPDSVFTLRDIINIVNESMIPIEVMSEILQCSFLRDYLEEMNKKPFENKGLIEYLEVYWCGEKSRDDVLEMSSQWDFHGVGYKGVVSEDIIKYIPLEKQTTYRENYAIEFSPIYELSAYEIRIRPEMYITDWEQKDPIKSMTTIPFRPSITLVELLYVIFWELSFCGSPKNRDDQKEEIDSRLKEVKEAEKNGTLDKICIPWEEVKERMKKRIE